MKKIAKKEIDKRNAKNFADITKTNADIDKRNAKRKTDANRINDKKKTDTQTKNDKKQSDINRQNDKKQSDINRLNDKNQNDINRSNDKEQARINQINEKAKDDLLINKNKNKAQNDKANEKFEDFLRGCHKRNLNNLRKDYFELFHCKIIHPPVYLRVGTDDIDIYSYDKLNEIYKNLNNNEFIQNWVKNVKIRTYEYICYLPPPHICPKNSYNLWIGLKGDELMKNFQPEDEAIELENIKIFLKHLWLLVGKNNDGLDYCLNYLAHMIQKPGVLPRTAILFKSDQGVGKNLFFEELDNNLLGSKYLLSTARMDNVIGRFPLINQKLMVILDETSGKDSFMASEAIKAYITAPKLVLEKKGIDGIEILNTGRSIFFTQSECGVKIEQSDRRFNAFECANDFRNNNDYNMALISAFDDKSKMASLFYFLKTRDISQWDPIQDRVITQLYKEMQTATIPIETKFISAMYQKHWHSCENEFLTLLSEEDDTETNLFKSNTFYELYNNWCKEIQFKPVTEMLFSKKFINAVCIKIKKSDGNYIQIKMEALVKYVADNTIEIFNDEEINDFPF
jgi:hypothetical protein